MIEQKHDKRKRGNPNWRKGQSGNPKYRGLDSPPEDKMIKEPEKKKEIWELLSERERSIHSGRKA